MARRSVPLVKKNGSDNWSTAAQFPPMSGAF